MVKKMGPMDKNGTNGVGESLLFEFLNDLFSNTS
jgi:hypothetical protein